MYIQSKLPHFGTTIFSTMSALATAHQAINLGQGFADYNMDTRLCDLVHHYMLQGHNQYAPMPGVLQLRQAIANKCNTLYNSTVNADTDITITAGGTYAIYTALSTIVQPGDEVIILEPAYDSYLANIVSNGGVPILVPLTIPTFSVDWQKVQDAITTKTKAIIVNTPHNPGSYTFTTADWQALTTIVNNTAIFVISDEVYEHIVFDTKPHLSILTQPQLWHRCIAVFSFGKVFNNTGWKIGYAIAPEDIMKEFRKMHQYIAFTINTPMQYAIADFLQEPNNYMQLSTILQQKRDLFLAAIKDSGFEVYAKAGGSFFQTVGYSNISNLPDVDFAIQLTKKYGVATIPLSAFYKHATDHKMIRFCFAKKEATLLAAADKLVNIQL